MGEDMDRDLPAAGLNRSELLDVLHRAIEAAGMDVGADARPGETPGWPQPPTFSRRPQVWREPSARRPPTTGPTSTQ
jgi:hypothetical protein